MDQSAVCCRRRIPRHHHSRNRLWVVATVLTLVFNLAWPLTQSTIVLQSPLISGSANSPASGFSSSRGGQVPWFLCRPSPVGFCFLFHRFLHEFEQAANLIFHARFSLRHELYPIVPLASPSRHRCVPLYSSVMEPNFVLPTLYVTGVPRHTPRGTASPPSGSSPSKNGTKSQHNCDITIVNGPRRSGPDFTRDFLSRQRETHLPPSFS